MSARVGPAHGYRVAALALTAACAALVLLPTASASAHTGDDFAEYGTATVDGVISGGEYEGSCIGPISYVVPGGSPYQLTICEQNDEQNDYYAVQTNDPTSPPGDDDSAMFWFDDDHDGAVAQAAESCPYGDPNEDQIGWFLGGFFDGLYCRQPGQTSFGSDFYPSGFDGTGAHVFTPGVGSVFEFSHPLDSGDSDDYSLAVHDKVGWCLTYDDTSLSPPTNPGFAFGEFQYPSGCFVDFSNSTGGLVRGDTTLFGDVTKLSELDELVEKLKNKLKDLVAICKFCPPDPRAKLLERINEAIERLGELNQKAAAKELKGFAKQTKHFINAEILPAGKAKTFIKKAKSFIKKIKAVVIPAEVPDAPAPVGETHPFEAILSPNGEAIRSAAGP